VIRFAVKLALGALALSSAGAASAQAIAYPSPQSEALGQCVVMSTTGKDRLVAIRWMATAIGSANVMKDAVTVDAAAKDTYDREVAALFSRLLTVDCRDEAKPLVKANDSAGLQAGFGALGRIAMMELMADPSVLSSLTAYVKYADLAAVAELSE
jgi:hypothetical protein